MPMYMKYADMKGDATHDQHKDWMTIESFQWGVGRGISTPTGSAARREASEPSVSEVHITKFFDQASNQLFERVLTGNKGEDVLLSFVRTGDPGEKFLTYKLYNTLISGYQVSSGGDRPTESLTLNFTKVEMNYTPFSADHKAGTPVRSSYDIALAKKE